MVHIECKAYRTIYVPVDKSARWAVLVPDPSQPHTHPLLPLTKPSFEARDLYKQCVAAKGLLSGTVRNIENGKLTVFEFSCLIHRVTSQQLQVLKFLLVVAHYLKFIPPSQTIVSNKPFYMECGRSSIQAAASWMVIHSQLEFRDSNC